MLRQRLTFKSLFTRTPRPEESPLRRAMRQAERRRFWSLRPQLLCILSACVVLVVLYLDATSRSSYESANAAAWYEEHGKVGWMQRQKKLVLSSSRHHNSSLADNSLRTEFAIPPLRQFPQRRDEDDEEDERFHNPSLYGWTPDVYPDPLVNPIRCAIAYLPETNMTDGLR